MNPRNFVGIALTAGLIAVAAVVSEGWATFAFSTVARMCIGFVGWDIWQHIHARH